MTRKLIVQPVLWTLMALAWEFMHNPACVMICVGVVAILTKLEEPRA